MFTKRNFSYTHGIVVDVTTREKVDGHSYGGGGMLIRGDGYIAPPSVSIYSTTIQEFWLKTKNGEQNFKQYDDILSMRKGHQVTVLRLDRSIVAFINHTTGKSMRYPGVVQNLMGRRHPSFFKMGCLLPGALFFGAGIVTILFNDAIRGASLFPLVQLLLMLVAIIVVSGFYLAIPLSLVGYFYFKNRHENRLNRLQQLVIDEVEFLSSHRSIIEVSQERGGQLPPALE